MSNRLLKKILLNPLVIGLVFLSVRISFQTTEVSAKQVSNKISLNAQNFRIAANTSTCEAAFTQNDYITPICDFNKHEIGFRLGEAVLKHEISKTPNTWLKKTRYNEIELHSIHYKGISDNKLLIGGSVRWKKYENNPLTGGRWKRGETNCDITVGMSLYVKDRDAKAEPAWNRGDCSTSGLTFENIYDHMFQGLSFIVTGERLSILDSVVNIAGWAASFSPQVKDSAAPFLEDFNRLNYKYPIYLSEIRFDSSGISYIFSYPSDLTEIVSSIRGLSLAHTTVSKIGVPNFMIRTPGYPTVAVFSERKESFALGCNEIRNMWSRIPVRTVSSQEYNSIQENNPVVADLPCDGSIKAYAPTNEPGALLIKHRNGVYYRHYVDHPDFVPALRSADLIPIDVSEFRARFPERGTDFKICR